MSDRDTLATLAAKTKTTMILVGNRSYSARITATRITDKERDSPLEGLDLSLGSIVDEGLVVLSKPNDGAAATFRDGEIGYPRLRVVFDDGRFVEDRPANLVAEVQLRAAVGRRVVEMDIVTAPPAEADIRPDTLTGSGAAS